MARPDRRDALIEQLTDHVLAHGLEAASLRPLGAAVGVSDRMLLYYFADKAELISAVLGRAATRLAVGLEAAIPAEPVLAAGPLQSTVLAALRDSEMAPFMRLWLEIVGRAARGEAPFDAVGKAIGLGFLAWIETRLQPSEAARRREEAFAILAAVEGVMVLAALGIDGEP